jgi:hypothetical protein
MRSTDDRQAGNTPLGGHQHYNTSPPPGHTLTSSPQLASARNPASCPTPYPWSGQSTRTRRAADRSTPPCSRTPELTRQTHNAAPRAQDAADAYRDDCVNLFATCGDTFAVTAVPRTRFSVPSSHKFIGVSSRTLGHRNSTRPPPSGWKPRRRVRIAKPAVSTPQACRSGGSAARSRSTDTSDGWFVTPVRCSSTGAFAKRHSGSTASIKYPIDLRRQRARNRVRAACQHRTAGRKSAALARSVPLGAAVVLDDAA